MSVQSSLVMTPIYEFGSDAHRKKYLPKLARESSSAASASPSPTTAPTPPACRPGRRRCRAATRSRLEDLDQQRAIADLYVIWAKNDDGKIRGFLVEKGAKGFRRLRSTGNWACAPSITGEVVMDGVFVPEENMLPGAEGLKGPFTCLNAARYGISWGALGAAEDCWHRARQYVLERKQFGRPLAATS